MYKLSIIYLCKTLDKSKMRCYNMLAKQKERNE